MSSGIRVLTLYLQQGQKSLAHVATSVVIDFEVVQFSNFVFDWNMFTAVVRQACPCHLLS